MKLAVVFAFVAVGIAVASAALTCITDENKCAEDECCVKISNFIGKCKKMKKEDERCEMHQGKSLIKKHVYLRMCPCAEGMKCVAKDGLIGKVLGTCQESSEEVVEKTEAPVVETEAPAEE